MKRLILLLFVIFITHNLFSQTNVFPPDGNVGIGTTTPDYKLDIKGIGRFGTSALIGTGVSAGYYQDSNNGAYRSLNVSENTGYYFQNYNGISTAMFIGLQGGYAGNVGIGTINPAYKLDVKGIGRFGTSALIGTGVSAGYYQDSSNGAYRSLNVSGNTGYYFQNYNGISTAMFIGLQGGYAGNVGIGTSTPDYKLDVLGTIRAKELKVDMQGADFVFEENYVLRPIEELEDYIIENKHLPEIAPAKEMEENGVNQSEMNQKLLQKIEELTLYVIDLNKRMNDVQNENRILKKESKK